MKLEASSSQMVETDMEPSAISSSNKDDGKVKWSSDHCTINSAMDETELNAATQAESVKKIFARRSDDVQQSSSSFSSQDLLNALTAKKVTRASLLSRIELDPTTNKLLLSDDRSNIRSRYGYDGEKHAYVYPEEALYLLELGKAEIFCNHVSLSIQRARSLLMVPNKKDGNRSRSGNLKYCTHEEYFVYKYLNRMGYCLYRFHHDIYDASNDSSFTPEEVGQMEMDDDVIIEEGQEVDPSAHQDKEDIIEVESTPEGATLDHRKALKRKSDNLYEDQRSESSDEMMEGCPEAKSPYLSYLVDEDSVQNEPSGYTVDEADSDVEIVDEVIFSHAGVEIQEIAHSVGYQDECMEMSDEPVPSTSKGPPEVLVDLVSSEDEDEDSKEFGKKVWTKFIPNSKVFFKIPPSKLIPQSVPSGDNVYEFDLKDKSDLSDLELEFLVDEVSLNDDKYGMCSSDSSQSYSLAGVQSWKEWRQNMFQEARNVMNNSLLSSSECINGEAATEKLFLWGETQKDSDPSASILNKIVFEMYGPSVQGFSRQKAFEGNPHYYVLISRQDESVPDFGLFGSSINGIPVLIAVVCDSNDVLFMTADRSPLNSLF